MPIRAAAVSAAFASGSGAAALNASTSGFDPAAKAEARATPSASSGARLERAMTPSRFSRMSLAKSGICSLMVFRNSMVVLVTQAKDLSFACGPWLERLAADRAVAGAELVGLQAVEDAQHLFRVAADVEVVHAHVLYRAFRVDDEGGAQGDAFIAVAHAELIDERALRVAEAPVAELAQVLVVPTPAE